MTHADEPLTTEQVAQHFHRALSERGDLGSPVSEEVVLDCARRSDVQDLLETLAALGHVEATDDGAYAT